MPDNITAPAAGTALATKDIGGVHYPKNVITDHTGADAFGEAVATPAVNTLLGRLKAIWDKLPTLGTKVASGSVSITPASDASFAVVPQLTSGGNIAAQTAGAGANYTAFADQACKQLTIVNNTGTKLEFRQGGAGVAVTIFDQAAFTIFGITNANQIGFRRADTSNMQVTAQARWEA